MRIVVIADTHTDDLDKIPKKVLDEMSGADVVVHAGDFTHPNLLRQLRSTVNLKAVRGNLDHPEVMRELPATLVLEVGKFKLGIAHPDEGGAPEGIESRVKGKFENVNAIIYGHTHKPKNEVIGGILFFNPGSATGKWPASFKSYGLLNVKDSIEGKIVKL